MVFGIILILLGGMAAMLVPLMVFGQIMAGETNQEAVSVWAIIPGAVFYSLAAVVLASLGFGSIKARRWARPLILVVAWSWLFLGVVSMAFMAWFFPKMLQAPTPAGTPTPEGVKVVVLIVTFGFLAFMFLLVPGVLIYFYQSPHVKATCDARDPVPRWTDACPLPVLGMSLWMGFSALMMLTMPLSANGVLPLFGVLISGWLGTLGYMVLATLWAYAAWGIYRLHVGSWWLALITFCLAGASAATTFLNVDFAQMYRLMGYSEKQIEMVQQYSFGQGNMTVVMSLVGAVPVVLYLLFVKKYFRPPPPAKIDQHLDHA